MSLVPHPSEPVTLETRDRLLQAAGEVFAEQGFNAARVRDICDRANANIAAVNYYFGDKARLYSAVLNYAANHLVTKYPFDTGLSAGPTAPQRLEAFVRAFLGRVFEDGRISWRGKLMAREMLEPSGALDELVRTTLAPQAKVLYDIVRDLGEGHLSEGDVHLCAQAVMGQCLLYRHARSVLLRLNPDDCYGEGDIGRLCSHVTRFSLAGIRDLVEQRK